jgi:hypothetical protein
MTSRSCRGEHPLSTSRAPVLRGLVYVRHRTEARHDRYYDGWAPTGCDDFAVRPSAPYRAVSPHLEVQAPTHVRAERTRDSAFPDLTQPQYESQ